MNTLRKAGPPALAVLVLIVALTTMHQAPPVIHAQSSQNDCSAFTFTFTGNATQSPSVPNLSANNPCVVWRLTFSATGTLSSTVSFQTSPDNTTFTAVPNSICSSSVQPPCVLQGANPTTGTQGMTYISAYGAYVRVVTSSSSGTGTGTVRVYGAKGASVSAGSGISGGGGSGTAPYVCIVTAVTSIPCSHNLGTTTPWIVCFDGSGNQLGSTGATTSVISVVATSSMIATLTFSGLTTATCAISTGSTGPIGATGATGPTGATGSATGNVTGPGSSTNGFIPTWSGTSGTFLATGFSIASLAPGAGCGTSVSGVAVSINPLDFSCFWIVDEFFPGAATAGTIGQTGFSSLAIGTTGCGSTAGAAPELNHPGIYKSTTATTFTVTALGCGVSHNGNGNGSGDYGDLSTQTNWEVRWIFKTGPSLTNIKIRVGIIPQSNAGTQADPPADGVWTRYLSGTDTNWTVTENTGNTPATGDSGVPIAVSTWYAVKIRSTSVGTWLMSMATAGGAFSAEKSICSSGCDVTATLTAVTTLGPGYQIITGDTTAKSLSVDLYGAIQTGLTR